MLHYLMAGYNQKWYYFLNSLVTYVMLVLIYFETSFWSPSPSRLPLLIKFAYLPLCYYFLESLPLCQVLHYLLIILGVSAIRKTMPKGLTFCENYSLVSVVALYGTFFAENIRNQEIGISMFMTAKCADNAILFAPVRFVNY